MTQTVAATAQLGPGLTGLAIGIRVLNLDGTTYSAFSTTGVAETAVLGTYRKASGAVVPDAGGYIVWGTAGTDYAEATVDSTAVNTTQLAGQTVTAAAGVTFPTSVGTSTYAGADTAGTTTLLARIIGTLAAGTHTAQTGDAYAVVTNATYGNSALHADIAVLGGGAGALTVTVTVTDGTNPVDGAEVWISTDNPATNVVAGTKTTNALGQVVFMLDAGTYYLWRQAAGVDFVNPETIIVS